MPRPVRAALAVIALMASLAAVVAPPASAAPEKDRYIVVLEDAVAAPARLARVQTEQREGRLGFIYRHALKGYSAELSEAAVAALRRDPRVKFVTLDHAVVPLEEELIETIDHEEVEIFEPTIPTGIDRTFATANEALDIDGEDDLRVDADVAVIDTGTNHNHSDLDVAGRTDCSSGTEKEAKCTNGSGTDVSGHGTHVAGTIGAIDNGIGVVGIAPGARIWAVKVLGTGTNYDSEVAAGIEWVTATREDENPENDIEVANLSLGCQCSLPATAEALEGSVEAGVVHVVAAGNSNLDAKFFSPAGLEEAVTVSALADYDGKPGGKASPTCANYGLDDRKASFSNYGAIVDLIAPGVCILSSVPGGYGKKSGTSMAAPLVAGAAAILAAQDSPEDAEDVDAIRDTIVGAGNFDWIDTSGDGVQEPLLDVGDEEIFGIGSPPEIAADGMSPVAGEKAALSATINPKGLATTYRFEYGTSKSYGSTIPSSPTGIGSGSEGVEVGQTIEGLTQDVTYHYRVAATSARGTSYSEDRTFEVHAPLFEAGDYPATFAGAQGTQLELATQSGSLKCSNVQFEAQAAGAATFMPLEAQHSECTAFGFAGATVAMNGCEYVLSVDNAGPPYEGAAAIDCPAGKAIQVSAKLFGTAKCTLTIPAQSGLGGVEFEPAGKGGEAEVVADLDLSGIEYATQAGTGFGACSSGGYEDGAYDGTIVVSGFDEAEEEIGAFVGGAEVDAHQPQLRAEGYPVTLVGSEGSTQEVKTAQGVVQCENAVLDGELTSAASETALGAEFTQCTAFGFAGATVVMNGCEYVLSVDNAGPPYEGGAEIDCPAGKAIQVSAKLFGTAKCTLTIPAQSGLGGVGFRTVGKGSQRVVEASLSLSGIEYATQAGTGFGACSSAEYEDGVYNGTVIVGGQGGPVGVFVSGQEAS